jgi:tetratricopeptide (TPR) repeat protein
MAQIVLDQQRRRDSFCGDYDVSGLIERLLPDEALFRSRGHLNPPIMQHLAEVLYSKLDATKEFMQYLATTRYDDLVPYSELPIHPSIGRELGLRYVSPDIRYQFFADGPYNFLEWAERYMRYEWNQDFNEAMLLARNGDMERAIPLWEKSMESSLRSSIGRANLAEIMVRNGMHQRAVRWIREAAAIEPNNPEYARRAKEIAAHAEWQIASAR